MSKAVLISIRPEWCNKIAGGQKSVEIRKTEPNLKKPFKCYIYCTKSTHFVDIPGVKKVASCRLTERSSASLLAVVLRSSAM